MINLSKRHQNALKFAGSVRKGEAAQFRSWCAARGLEVFSEFRTTFPEPGRVIGACNGRLRAFIPERDQETLMAAFDFGWSPCATIR